MNRNKKDKTIIPNMIFNHLPQIQIDLELCSFKNLKLINSIMEKERQIKQVRLKTIRLSIRKLTPSLSRMKIKTRKSIKHLNL